MKYWTQSVGALRRTIFDLNFPFYSDLLPAGSAGDLPGQDVPRLGGEVRVGVGESDGVAGSGSELHVH